MSSYFIGLLISLSLVGGAQASHAARQSSPRPFNEMSQEALKAIHEYFLSSDRKVKSVKIGTISWIVGQEYLVEAEVIAQAGFTQEYIPYHCGAFVEKITEKSRIRWSVKFTTCEAYTLSVR